MVQVGYLVSTLLTGVVLVGIAVAIVRGVDWEGYTPEHGEGPGLARRAAEDPRAWMLAFFALLAAFGGGAVLFVGGFSVPQSVATMAGIVLGAATLVVVIGYVFYGTYLAARSRGRPSSMAAAQGATVLGGLFLVALVVKLVFLG